jgi:hypothetical protein
VRAPGSACSVLERAHRGAVDCGLRGQMKTSQRLTLLVKVALGRTQRGDFAHFGTSRMGFEGFKRNGDSEQLRPDDTGRWRYKQPGIPEAEILQLFEFSGIRVCELPVASETHLNRRMLRSAEITDPVRDAARGELGHLLVL